MNEGEPLISIISINYNEPELTYLFLDSVSKLDYPNLEVIIIENASSRPVSEELVSQHLPGARVCFASSNGGFGSGNNLGMAAASGDYVFIVNNDTELKADLMQQLLLPFLTDQSVGVVCPKILYYDAPDTIQYAGFTAINELTGRNRAIAYREKDLGQYDSGGPTFGAHGAAMLVKKEVIVKAGMFYEPYFLYYEELDWSCRIRASGFTIYYQPTAVIWHKESMSVGRNSPMKIFYLARNRVLFMKRNSAGYKYFLFLVYNLAIALPNHSIRYLVQKEFKLFRAFVLGNFRGLLLSPGKKM